MLGIQNAANHLKVVKPLSWFEDRGHEEFVSHLLLELGRNGLSLADIECHERSPDTKAVLSDLLGWMSGSEDSAFSTLYDWRAIDFDSMVQRVMADKDAKPRIEISASITQNRNLSVRWHPGGWNASRPYAGGPASMAANVHSSDASPDFASFSGDEEPSFDGRASNELMYIRGVGNLNPEPRDLGTRATHNHDVTDSILICAVRAAYESLIRRLRWNFEVEVLQAFDFEFREESDQARRVVGWALEPASEVQARRERERRGHEAQGERDRPIEPADAVAMYGLTLDGFISALAVASSKKRHGPEPTEEGCLRNAAKRLRECGATLDVDDVRRLTGILGRHCPERLPERLRPAVEAKDPGNVVQLRPRLSPIGPAA